jgi:hypothetical protein
MLARASQVLGEHTVSVLFHQVLVAIRNTQNTPNMTYPCPSSVFLAAQAMLMMLLLSSGAHSWHLLLTVLALTPHCAQQQLPLLPPSLHQIYSHTG